jgi:hypothetical protein
VSEADDFAAVRDALTQSVCLCSWSGTDNAVIDVISEDCAMHGDANAAVVALARLEARMEALDKSAKQSQFPRPRMEEIGPNKRRKVPDDGSCSDCSAKTYPKDYTPCTSCGAECGHDYCAPCPATASGAELIAAERQRQIDAEGWTPEHDDTHADGELACAAACYAIGRANVTIEGVYLWPWENRWWKPAPRIRELVKAGALIAAEIDRVARLDEQKGNE